MRMFAVVATLDGKKGYLNENYDPTEEEPVIYTEVPRTLFETEAKAMVAAHEQMLYVENVSVEAYELIPGQVFTLSTRTPTKPVLPSKEERELMNIPVTVALMIERTKQMYKNNNASGDPWNENNLNVLKAALSHQVAILSGTGGLPIGTYVSFSAKPGKEDPKITLHNPYAEVRQSAAVEDWETAILQSKNPRDPYADWIAP